MRRTQVQLTDAQALALRDLSAAQDKSMAQLIREAVDAFLRSSQRPANTDLRQRAIEAAGKFRSDVPDLATHHNDYLSESYGEGDLR